MACHRWRATDRMPGEAISSTAGIRGGCRSVDCAGAGVVGISSHLLTVGIDNLIFLHFHSPKNCGGGRHDVDWPAVAHVFVPVHCNSDRGGNRRRYRCVRMDMGRSFLHRHRHGRVDSARGIDCFDRMVDGVVYGRFDPSVNTPTSREKKRAANAGYSRSKRISPATAYNSGTLRELRVGSLKSNHSAFGQIRIRFFLSRRSHHFTQGLLPKRQMKIKRPLGLQPGCHMGMAGVHQRHKGFPAI
jgi:hypothetical protein